MFNRTRSPSHARGRSHKIGQELSKLWINDLGLRPSVFSELSTLPPNAQMVKDAIWFCLLNAQQIFDDKPGRHLRVLAQLGKDDTEPASKDAQ